MRITGLASGLDMDEIVKNSMKPYRVKIEKKSQDKEILEIKQKLYREVIKDSREFYNKYFDVTKSDSLLLSKNWSSIKFKSSDENVLTVTGSGDAKAENYTITGHIAKAAKVTLKLSEIKDNKVIVNGKEFTLKGDNEKEKANDLSSQLKTEGINVSVTYSEFAGKIDTSTNKVINESGFIFESTVLGKDNTFVIGGTFVENIATVSLGVDAKAASNTLELSVIEDKKISINGTLVDLTGKTSDTEVVSYLNEVFKEKSIAITASIKEEQDKKSVVLTYNIPGEKYNVDVKAYNVDDKEYNIDIGLPEKGIDAKAAINTVGLSDIANKKISINGNLIDLTGKGILNNSDGLTEEEKIKDQKNKLNEVIDHINKVFKEQNTAITASVDNGQVVIKSNVAGSKNNIDLKIAGDGIKLAIEGNDAEFIIRNTKGGAYSYKGISNTVVVEGMTFKFTGEIPSGGVSANGKQDIAEIKEKLVKFINDYNTLTEKLNKLTTDKRNRNFNPLTADQKKEMSEDEIKLWNEKVEKGQLSRDSDVSRISNSLKQAMRNFVDGVGLNLKDIGITPVADYQGTQNGTFTVDDAKLTKALEENIQQVMDMFVKSAPKNEILSESKKYSKTGIMNRIKDVLYKETITVTSSLLKKAGFEGSSTVYNNEITKSIEKYEQKMADMEKDFTRREQALYTKYSNLETIMNKYNSQQSYLSQQLGLS